MDYFYLGICWSANPSEAIMNLFTNRPQDGGTDANAQAFMMQQMLMSNAFITLAMVDEVSEDGDIVSVKPMIDGFTGSGDRIPKTIIYGVPVWRLQRGASAVIMTPVAGDIGLIAICDRDISGVKATRESSLPGSNRTHNYADAIYLGGVLNADPSQYVRFANDGIDIVSPLSVNINAPMASFSDDVSIGGELNVIGEVTGAGVKLSTHVHGGVESGGSNTQGPS